MTLADAHDDLVGPAARKPYSLLSWTHSGFSVCAQQAIAPTDSPKLERLARYTTCSPIRAGIGCGTTGRAPVGPAAGQTEQARLLRKLLEVDPLVCGRCRARMQVIAVITDPRVVDDILGCLAHGGGHDPFDGRAPPRRVDLTERCL